MTINTDINILGGLPDWNLVKLFLNIGTELGIEKSAIHTQTAIKTGRSIELFENAISKNLIKFKNSSIEVLVKQSIEAEGISQEVLILLFWNASYNNLLLNILNERVFFPAFFSGRITIKSDEVVACIKDMKATHPELKEWSEYTLSKVASKYLTLLKKFGLMEGGLHKTILHPFLSDKMFIIFLYWLKATEAQTNLIQSPWLKYGLMEQTTLLERLMNRKHARYINIIYTGDRLEIEPMIPYSEIYHANHQS